MGRFPLLVVMLAFLIVAVNGGQYGKPRPPNPQAFGVCALPLSVGPCWGYCPRYYYDARRGRCLPFTYGCCGGNANNFQRLSLCQRVCESRACPAIACLVNPCQFETCPNVPGAVCHSICACQSVWLYNGEDVSGFCHRRG
ncbi:PI-stichotoxin-Hcr2i-like isoform X2 [Ostrea edulis]|uniref:PI-stichotoxin-Hcr2i-like isoform X2 n=1 Tax=Ostrea edulis TaxID=37623 RepID=UPI0024AEED38|nr:PI-stichotoxin-Hcr2i-like isoform X2 [Ostrea edulis]